MSAFLGLLGHRLANFPPHLAANCTSLALGLPTATTTTTPPPAPSSSSSSRQKQQQQQYRGRPSSIAGTMLFSGTLGIAAMSLFQLVTMRAFLSLLFGGDGGGPDAYVREFLRSGRGRAHLDATLSAAEVARRAAMARDGRYGLFVVLFGLVSAGWPEEVLKYLPAATVRWWRARKARKARKAKAAVDARSSSSTTTPRGEEKGGEEEKEEAAEEEEEEEVMGTLEFVNYTVAAGIGFAAFENAGVIYGSIVGGSSAAEVFLLLAERTFSALPGHVLCAALSGIRGSSTSSSSSSSSIRRRRCRRRRRRRRSAEATKGGGLGRGLVEMLIAILPSALYHGVFDSALLGLSASCGHPGWVRPTNPWVLAGGYGLVVALQGTLALNVRAAWRREVARALVEEEEEKEKAGNKKRS